MSDVYFIRVEGADVDLMESLLEAGPDMQTGNNIIVVPEIVEPLDKGIDE